MQVRIFMEGAFDLMHYGHMNAFRLGAALGTKLVVGVRIFCIYCKQYALLLVM